MGRSPSLARRFYERFEPVHGITYFAPECRSALDALGYRGFWMGYMAARSAPLGQVPADVVAAVFYNFTTARVAKALPAAWEIAGPTAALAARLDSAVAVLRRSGVIEDEATRTAADLAAKAARTAPLDGRALYAANRALDWPDNPIAQLWHAATLLREQRGDAHVAILVGEGITGRQSNVLHAASGRTPRETLMRTRDYDDEQWVHYSDELRARGLLCGAGELTEEGRRLKQTIEDRTDAAALTALDGLTDVEVETLFQTLTPITRQVVAAGDLPAATPMGLRHGDLADGSAHLS
ncbi:MULTISPECIES: SCO6745 family protein [unclassified Mycolicibacterium]|uniref:SCO6745 family protein n=1 Tax=unclassified Mycolicibacterium TaxID=2636767 RepID=UPI002ED8AEB0